MHKQVTKQTNEINNRDVAQSVILWKNSHKTDSQWIAEAHWVMYWLMFLEQCSYSSLCPWSQSTLYLMKLRKNGLTGRQKSWMCHLMKMRLKASWGFDVPRETRWHLRGHWNVAKLVMIHRQALKLLFLEQFCYCLVLAVQLMTNLRVKLMNSKFSLTWPDFLLLRGVVSAPDSWTGSSGLGWNVLSNKSVYLIY